MLMLMLVSNSSSQHIKEFFCLPRFRGHNRRSFNATGTASKIRQYQKVAVSHTRAAKSTTLQRTWRKTKTGMRDREKEQIELRQNKEEHMGGELTRHRWVQLATCVSNQPRHEEGTQRSNRGDTNTWAAECFTENCSTQKTAVRPGRGHQMTSGHSLIFGLWGKKLKYLKKSTDQPTVLLVLIQRQSGYQHKIGGGDTPWTVLHYSPLKRPTTMNAYIQKSGKCTAIN